MSKHTRQQPRIVGFGTGEQQRKAALAQASKFQKLSCREGGKFDWTTWGKKRAELKKAQEGVSA